MTRTVVAAPAPRPSDEAMLAAIERLTLRAAAMTVARNPWHNFAGPRLRRQTEPLLQDTDSFGDPAKGEPVHRCRTCGRPSMTPAGYLLPLYLFELRLGGKRVGTYRLCGACFGAANPFDPQSGDPLQAA